MKQLISCAVLLALLGGIVEVQAQMPNKANRVAPQAMMVAGTLQYQNLNINNLSSWLRADGFSNQSAAGNNGVYFPKGTASVVYGDGLIWGGKPYLDALKTQQAMSQPVRVGGGTYNGIIGTRAGRIMGFGAAAVAADPFASDSRIFKIRRDYAQMSDLEVRLDAAAFYEISPSAVTTSQENALRNQYATDWAQWPANFGAPYIERNGMPGFQSPPAFGPGFTADDLITGNYDEPGIAGGSVKIPADEVVWTVYNDLDPSMSTQFEGSNPLGLEIQITMWGYKTEGTLGNVIFKRAKFINKGGVDIGGGVKGSFWIDSLYLAQWSDPDMGDSGDDVVGCDTLLSLGYVYNGHATDANFSRFSLPPPAVGYDFFQGPIVQSPGDVAVFDLKYRPGYRNLGMTSFSYFSAGSQYSDPPHGTASYYQGTYQWYQMLRGFAPIEGSSFGSPDVAYNSGPFPESKFPFSGNPLTGTGFLDGLGTNYAPVPGDRRIILNTGPFSLAPGDTQEVVVALMAGMGSDRLSSISVLKSIDVIAQAMYNGLFTSSPPAVSATVSYPSGSQARIAFQAIGGIPKPTSMSLILNRLGGSYHSTVQLLDDGAHNDGLAGDGMFGGSTMIAREQAPLSADVQFTDAASNPYTFHQIIPRITIIGPVEIMNYTIFADNKNGDNKINPGEDIRFGLRLLNGTAYSLDKIAVSAIPSSDGRVIRVGTLASQQEFAFVYNPADFSSYFSFNVPLGYSDSLFRLTVFTSDSIGNVWVDTARFPVYHQTTPVYGTPVVHAAGSGMWMFSTIVVDRAALKSHQYEITIVDSVGFPAEKRFTLTDVTTSTVLLSRWALPDELGFNVPVTDGFRVLRGEPWGVQGINPDSTRWVSPNPAWFGGFRFTLSGQLDVALGSELPNYLANVLSTVDQSGVFKVEVRFNTATPGKAYRLRRTGASLRYQLQTNVIAGVAPNGEPFVNIPFTAWDVSNPVAPRQLTVSWRDQDSSGTWDPPVGTDGIEIVFIHARTYDPLGRQFTYPANPVRMGAVVDNELTMSAESDIVYGLSLAVLSGHVLNENPGTLVVVPFIGLQAQDVFTFRTQVAPYVPNLVSWRDGTTRVTNSPYLDWQPADGADTYRLQISTDPTFTSVTIDSILSEPRTYYSFSGPEGSGTYSRFTGRLAWGTTYYWRVNAINPYGTSDWSQMWRFTTILRGPTWPVRGTNGPTNLIYVQYGAPLIGGDTLRADDAVGVFFRRNDSLICGGWTRWFEGRGTGLYAYGDDPSTVPWKEGFVEGEALQFKIWDAHTLREYMAQPTYQTGGPGFSANGYCEISSLAAVTALPPPASWQFTSNTGNNATIAVTMVSAPRIGNELLHTGDAVGVFFTRNDSTLCAGYSVWQDGQNLSITAWGDNDQTPVKEGFSNGELMKFRVWDSEAGRDFPATVQYAQGGTTYTGDGIYVLSSLVGVTSMTHGIILSQGWNMVSTFVLPKDSMPEVVMSKIIPHMILMKNGAGQVFWPGIQVNTIGALNWRHGYQIYMTAADTGYVTGDEIPPHLAVNPLRLGWNLVSYLRNSPMRADTALASLGSSLKITKNNAGQVYWPELGINNIGNMKPGQGYQMYLTSPVNLVYPANVSAAPPLVMTKHTSSVVATRSAEPAHFKHESLPTGTNAVVLLESSAFKPGDEAAVWTSNGILAGSGVATEGKALVTVWGDDLLTEDRCEGARENEELHVAFWSKSTGTESDLSNLRITDALNGGKELQQFRFSKDAVLRIEVSAGRQLPTEFGLEQNYPNPFNPSTVIRFALPKDVRVELAVFNLLGQCVAMPVSGEMKAGYHEAILNAASLPSGIYFYRISAGSFVETRKMQLVK